MGTGMAGSLGMRAVDRERAGGWNGIRDDH
jgi:hypothetical protein